ncbi:MAG: PD-(D/E)XK nuclease family protein, partial [Firmicutes bacterium]|nr:PD-(D/E)XK nuclease family protein [Bacillota bacterium]
GDLFHFVLADVGSSLAKKNVSWGEVDQKLAQLLVDQSLSVYLPRFLAGIMSSSARYAYLEDRIRRALVTAVLLTAEHMKQGKFVPVAFELPFGRGENGLPALRIRLEDGRELVLTGQIDRVDMAESDDGERAYLRVVDYKTGNNKLKIADVEAGLQLQLLAYLQVVMDNSAVFTARYAQPAGVYYAHVHDDTVLSDDEDGSGPGMRLSGVTVPSQEVARLSDPAVNGWSKLVNLYCNDKGSLNTGLEEGQMQELRQRVIHMLKDSAAAMLEGLVAVSPLADDDRDACAFCDFAAVCGFDRGAVKARSRCDALPGREAAADD